MYDRILVPTDGSPQAARALEHALDLARTYDAQLHVLFVVDATAFASEVDASLVTDELESYGERAVESAAERASEAGIESVSTAVLRGTPHREILDYAEGHDVDLVVLGTHGRRGLDRYLLGSVTERIVRTADVPVLVVRSGDETAETTD
ncbi:MULTISPECIES: universal stress protein [Halorussus]|uniref:universal stress protein n=1 Tax=Halorussus TaxID=1070314 RepID=UPI00209E0505|nr:universal stress protein [Halorussus vallis]USZ78105.1 universal stress protein [Halorussus vallis]